MKLAHFALFTTAVVLVLTGFAVIYSQEREGDLQDMRTRESYCQSFSGTFV